MSNDLATEQPVAISIIVPVYNVADFIEECLSSIEQQSFCGDYEVILIDDCSTDNSVEICRRFVSANPEIFSLIESSQNEGVSAARNHGLESMHGRYFMFVDSDDLLPVDALAALHRAAEDSRATIVKGNNTIIGRSIEKQARYNVQHQSLVRGDEILTTLYQHEKVRGHAGGKLFRSDKLAGFRFQVGIAMVEDLLYCCEVFAHADSLLLLDRPVYRYRYRESGATGLKFENGACIEWLDTVEKTVQFARNAKQLQAHKSLLVRTITQLSRECRKLPRELAKQVLPEIERRREKWDIDLVSLIFKHRLGIRSISRYAKLRLAIRMIRQNLA